MLRAVKLGLAAVTIAAFAGVLGTAGAQDPAPSSARTLTVNGSGSTTVPVGAPAGDRQSAYQSALGDAIDAAKAKAAFMAGRSGVTLGSIKEVNEWTDSPDRWCDSFGGAVPDAAVGKGVSAPTARKVTTRRPAAKAADVTRCYIPAAVSVTYALSG